MFDICMSELLVVFIVALLVFGPKRLPELARALGKGLAEIKRSLNDAKRQVQTEFREIESQEKGIGKGFADIKQSLQDVKKQMDAGYKDILTSAAQSPFPKQDEKTYEEEEVEEEEEPEEEEETEEEETEEEEKKDNKIMKEEETAKKEPEKE